MYPRASLIAVIVASVPVDTRRTRSIGVGTGASGATTRPAIRSASSTSAPVGAPKDRPLVAASRTASTTSGCACPSSAGPHEATRST